MRKDVDKHMAEDCPNREYKCQYCGLEGTYNDIVHIHDKKCELKILPCENSQCHAIMPRQHAKKHAYYDCEK